jgi:hypothetical protein
MRPIPQGEPAPLDAFRAVAAEALWRWWRELTAGQPSDDSACDPETDEATHTTAKDKKRKRSTSRGDAEAQLIAGLTKHHRYNDGSCLNLDPIGNNELARRVEVSEGSASAFFKKKFKGYTQYLTMCRDTTKLVTALKLLNQEFSPHHLFGSKPPGEADRDDKRHSKKDHCER